MSRTETVRRIRGEEFPGHHVRKIGGLDTPVSNPNREKGDNLG